MRFFRSGSLFLLIVLFVLSSNLVKAQRSLTHWANNGYQYYKITGGEITVFDTRDTSKKTVWISTEMLTPKGGKPIGIKRFTIADDGKKVLINTNTKKVWRYDTRGDYWVFDTGTQKLWQLGKNLPESSLMFA